MPSPRKLRARLGANLGRTSLRLEDRLTPTPYVVTRTDDYDPTVYQITDPEAQGTLRRGVLDDKITKISFAPGLYSAGPATVFVDFQSLRIVDHPVEIIGPGTDNQGTHLITVRSIINGGVEASAGNVFFVQNTLDGGNVGVSMSDFAVTKGNSTNPGGGIRVGGAVNFSLSGMRLYDNRSTKAGGGLAFSPIDGIGAPPDLGPYIPNVTISNSRIDGNRATNLSQPDQVGGGIAGGGGGFTVTDSQIDGNIADDEGGGVYISGKTATQMTRTLVAGNQTYEEERGLGGGFVIAGPDNATTFTSCTFDFNSGPNGGGGLLTIGLGGTIVGTSTLTIDSCTFKDNVSAKGSGGAVSLLNPNFNTLIVNSTFSENKADDFGGAINVYASDDYPFTLDPPVSKATKLDIFNTTITLNEAGHVQDDGMGGQIGVGDGGGIAFRSGSEGNIKVSSTIVAQNVTLNTLGDFGHDLWSPTAFGPAGFNNLVGIGNFGNVTLGGQAGTKAAPLFAGLEALADNGGPTLTHALAPGSPAFNKGNNELGLPSDQRGGGNLRVRGPEADVGAFEECLLAGVQINGNDDVQRSMVTSIKVTFNTIAQFDGGDANAAGAFELKQVHPNYPNGNVTLVANVSAVGGQTVVVLTFTGSFVEYTSLKDGVYQLTIFKDSFDPDDNYLFCGMNGTYLTHRLFGDDDGDMDNDSQDWTEFRAAYATGSPWWFDFDQDGDIDAADWNAFRARSGINL